ncbi:hypothetical protein GWI33_019737 [Rhynchophorus ferrugineus]|uniref:Uncharacterized protein n=1 Tax=Rhynchophorus ferrugineus TaxID=354439 RepID=A0A834HT24_RHYFE|nr:hypothetical protein GWI33_019737 [Rhynchophorus ferrugineus]
MEDSKKLERCKICQDLFPGSTMLQNSKNMFYCTGCFKSSFTTENKMVGAGDTKAEICSNIGTKMIPRPEMYVEHPQISQLRGRQSILSLLSLSKRPLQCPKADCNKYISICTLVSHFRHEHKEVPVVSTHLDARCASTFCPRDIRYCIIQCVVVLKMINSEFANVCRASKVNLSKNEDRSDEECQEISHRRNERHIFRPGDKIIVWIASNFNTNLSYTVAVSTLNNNIRQKYYGPLLTLNENPTSLCKEGRCLILTHYHCNTMTDNGKNDLCLDVVVHSP